jgi:hypothetical protein
LKNGSMYVNDILSSVIVIWPSVGKET